MEPHLEGTHEDQSREGVTSPTQKWSVRFASIEQPHSDVEDSVLSHSEYQELQAQFSPAADRTSEASPQSTRESQGSQESTRTPRQRLASLHMLGSGFFKSIDEENESLQLFEKEWNNFDFKLQLSEEQMKSKLKEVTNKIEGLQAKISQKYSHGNLPYDITLANYESLKRRGAPFLSEPMYTHPGGYRFRFEIYPAGVGMAEGRYLSVNVLALKGDYDPLLKHPASFTISLHLLNQQGNHSHHQRNVECMYCDLGVRTEIGSEFEFIRERRLYLDEEKETEFLANNVLQFRVTKITFS